jgi:hypothetical protein
VYNDDHGVCNYSCVRRCVWFTRKYIYRRARGAGSGRRHLMLKGSASGPWRSAFFPPAPLIGAVSERKAKGRKWVRERIIDRFAPRAAAAHPQLLRELIIFCQQIHISALKRSFTVENDLLKWKNF